MYLYNRLMYDKFKFKFDGLENIEQSYSQALQDMFVLSVLNGKKNGTFLEIGAFDGKFLSNTYLLEKDFGWSGISIDCEESARKSFETTGRKAKMLVADATKIDYSKLFEETGYNKFDFIQFDIEPMENTLLCLKQMPLSRYGASVIIYEHDHYDPHTTRGFADWVREESRNIFKSHGYILVNGNVENLGNDEFEDWYLLKEDFDKKTIDKFKRENDLPLRACQYFGLEL